MRENVILFIFMTALLPNAVIWALAGIVVLIPGAKKRRRDMKIAGAITAAVGALGCAAVLVYFILLQLTYK